jgi:hypothetical protein
MHLARSSVRRPKDITEAPLDTRARFDFEPESGDLRSRAAGPDGAVNADLADPQDLAKSFRIDGRGHQQRKVADLTGLAAFHDGGVEVEIRMLALDPPVPRGLDRASRRSGFGTLRFTSPPTACSKRSLLPGPGILPALSAFITSRTAKPIRFRVQQAYVAEMIPNPDPSIG